MCQAWWHTPLISGLRRQRQVNLFEMEASLVFIGRSRPGGYMETLSPKQNRTKFKSGSWGDVSADED